MASGTLCVIAHFKVKAESVDAFGAQAQRELVEPTRGEPGCIAYELWQDAEDPTRFAMVEEWESEEDLQRHLEKPSLREAVGRLMPLGDGPVEVRRLRRPAAP